MMESVTGVVVIGFIAGITSGTVLFIASWAVSAAMNIIKSAVKGDDET